MRLIQRVEAPEEADGVPRLSGLASQLVHQRAKKIALT